MPFVYMVRCADGTLYTGWAVDVARRVKIHNAGRGARYTRTRCPVELVYSEALPTRAAAMRRERAIKRYSRARKLALCSGAAVPRPPAVPGRPAAKPTARKTRRGRVAGRGRKRR
jgi:putative endonuclease